MSTQKPEHGCLQQVYSYCENSEGIKKSRCPIVAGWTNTMEYHSRLKRTELSSHEKMWRNLKCTLLSEGSQSEKATYCLTPTIWYSGKGITVGIVYTHTHTHTHIYTYIYTYTQTHTHTYIISGFHGLGIEEGMKR